MLYHRLRISKERRVSLMCSLPYTVNGWFGTMILHFPLFPTVLISESIYISFESRTVMPVCLPYTFIFFSLNVYRVKKRLIWGRLIFDRCLQKRFQFPLFVHFKNSLNHQSVQQWEQPLQFLECFFLHFH